MKSKHAKVITVRSFNNNSSECNRFHWAVRHAGQVRSEDISLVLSHWLGHIFSFPKEPAAGARFPVLISALGVKSARGVYSEVKHTLSQHLRQNERFKPWPPAPHLQRHGRL